MTQITDQQHLQRHLRIVRGLAGVAVLGALTAGVAALLLIATDTTGASTSAAAIGSLAATGGIVAAVCTVAAAIYAQVRNLWQYAPAWIRVAAWGVIAWSLLTTLWTRSAV